MTQLSMYAGKTAEWSFPVKKVDGTAQPLTSCTLRFTAKRIRADGDSAVVLSKTSPASGVYITDSAAGLCEVRLAPADTAALAVPVELTWDLQVRDGTGKDWVVDDGTLAVVGPVWAGAVVAP